MREQLIKLIQAWQTLGFINSTLMRPVDYDRLVSSRRAIEVAVKALAGVSSSASIIEAMQVVGITHDDLDHQ